MQSRIVMRQKAGSNAAERLTKGSEERDLQQSVKHTPPLALPGQATKAQIKWKGSKEQ
jgi:hypothetical protein